MIIVEGFDGSGKTTAALKLSEWMAFKYLHAGSKPDDVTASLDRCHARMGMPVVQDRITHISEAVYGLLTRRENAKLALERLSDLMAAKLLVYCRPSITTILKNVYEHKMKAHDIPEDVDAFKLNAELLIQEYDATIDYARRYVSVVVYDYTKTRIDILRACTRMIHT